MIDHERRVVFVHIPKAGGNSVNAVFGWGWSPHRNLEAYAPLAKPPGLDGYFKLAMVRNPWARLFSDYNYQLRKSRGVKLHILNSTGRVRKFDAWVDAVIDDPFKYPGPDWGGKPGDGIHRWSPQVDWILLDGRPACDVIVRAEQARREFPLLAGRLGLPGGARLPRRNGRFHFPWRWQYSSRLAEKVGRHYERDIHEFGYHF